MPTVTTTVTTSAGAATETTTTTVTSPEPAEDPLSNEEQPDRLHIAPADAAD